MVWSQLSNLLMMKAEAQLAKVIALTQSWSQED